MQTWTFGKTEALADGPWKGEPDKAQWIDPDTDLDCLIHRGPMGALCGYVGVPPGHPCHGTDYSELRTADERELVDVHGGLTYSAACRENEDGSGICHIPEPGRPGDVWWFGFDCGHFGDIAPRYEQTLPVEHRSDARYSGDETYKTFDYVKAEVTRLAAQLKDLG